MISTYRTLAALLLSLTSAALLVACAPVEDTAVAPEMLAALAPVAEPAPSVPWIDPYSCPTYLITHYCPSTTSPIEGGCLDAHDRPVCTTEDVRQHKKAVCGNKSRDCSTVTIACDPKVIHQGTCFHIQGSDLTYCCDDVGSAIKGCHIDVAVDCDKMDSDYDNNPHGVIVPLETAAVDAAP